MVLLIESGGKYEVGLTGVPSRSRVVTSALVTDRVMKKFGTIWLPGGATGTGSTVRPVRSVFTVNARRAPSGFKPLGFAREKNWIVSASEKAGKRVAGAPRN